MDGDEIKINSNGFIVPESEGLHESLFSLGITYLKDNKEEPIVNFGLNSSFKNKCLFLDRDGILNIDSGYVKNISEIKIIDEAKNLISWAIKIIF